MSKNQVERLYKNIKILVDTNMLEEEFEVFASENPDLNNIDGLNDIIEDEISYWEE
jgi:hypothetical protein